MRALVRAARAIAGSTGAAHVGESLERRFASSTVPGRIERATPHESGAFALAIAGEPRPGFAAFLDGVQESRAVAWLATGAPIVVATVGAVVLERIRGSLVRWEHGLRRRDVLLAPRELISAATWNALAAAADTVDTHPDPDARHPDTLLLRAVHAVEELRAAEERALAQAWATHRREPLYVDGSIASLGVAALSPLVVGVVKSHRTLYVDAASLPALFALREGERTRVHTLAPSTHRAVVWTWYLRLREASAADPLRGLARIEVVPRDAGAGEVADAVSRWVLAERTPLALPNARWDVLSYGVARCEAYLRHGLGLSSTEVGA